MAAKMPSRQRIGRNVSCKLSGSPLAAGSQRARATHIARKTRDNISFQIEFGK
jgi:hypothetical protein